MYSPLQRSAFILVGFFWASYGMSLSISCLLGALVFPSLFRSQLPPRTQPVIRRRRMRSSHGRTRSKTLATTSEPSSPRTSICTDDSQSIDFGRLPKRTMSVNSECSVQSISTVDSFATSSTSSSSRTRFSLKRAWSGGKAAHRPLPFPPVSGPRLIPRASYSRLISKTKSLFKSSVPATEGDSDWLGSPSPQDPGGSRRSTASFDQTSHLPEVRPTSPRILSLKADARATSRKRWLPLRRPSLTTAVTHDLL